MGEHNVFECTSCNECFTRHCEWKYCPFCGEEFEDEVGGE